MAGRARRAGGARRRRTARSRTPAKDAGDRILRKLAQADVRTLGHGQVKPSSPTTTWSAPAAQAMRARCPRAVPLIRCGGHGVTGSSSDYGRVLARRNTAPSDMGFIGDEVVVRRANGCRNPPRRWGSFARDVREREMDEDHNLRRRDARGAAQPVVSSCAGTRDGAAPAATTRLAAEGGRHTSSSGGSRWREKRGRLRDAMVGPARGTAPRCRDERSSLVGGRVRGEGFGMPSAAPEDHRRPRQARRISGTDVAVMALKALAARAYAFTHMVNVVGAGGGTGPNGSTWKASMLCEIGFAALMTHRQGGDATGGARQTRQAEEGRNWTIMKRHVVDSPRILRRTPEMPALAPVVAFEHHLRQDLSGYPEKIGQRKLNLCTGSSASRTCTTRCAATGSIAKGCRATGSRSIISKKDDPAFNQRLLRRFINLMGLSPVGSARAPEHGARMAVVTHEHPTDPFRPQVKLVPRRGRGTSWRDPHAREHLGADGRGEFPPGRRGGHRCGSGGDRSAAARADTDGRTSALRSPTRAPGSRRSSAPAGRRCAQCRCIRADIPQSGRRSAGSLQLSAGADPSGAVLVRSTAETTWSWAAPRRPSPIPRSWSSPTSSTAS